MVFSADVVAAGTTGITTTPLNDSETIVAKYEGSDVTVQVVGSDAPASVVSGADIITNNGVVHQIDRVLLPTGLELPSTMSIASNLGRISNLSRFSTILNSNDGYNPLVAALSDMNAEFTLFAPSDIAFARFDSSYQDIDCLSDDDIAFCASTFFYHAFGSQVLSGDIADGTSFVKSAATAASAGTSFVNLGDDGQGLEIVKSDSGIIRVNGKRLSNVVSLIDIQCGNGVIHLIDEVIVLPNSLETVTNGIGELSEFNELVDTDLLATLDIEASITVFAPDNSGVSAYVQDNIDCDSVGCLIPPIKYHVAPGVFYSTDVIAAAPIMDLPTLDTNGTLDITVEDGAVKVKDAAGNKAQVITADYKVRNGVVHVIDSVLLLDSASVAQVTGAAAAVVAMASALLA